MIWDTSVRKATVDDGAGPGTTREQVENDRAVHFALPAGVLGGCEQPSGWASSLEQLCRPAMQCQFRLEFLDLLSSCDRSAFSTVEIWASRSRSMILAVPRVDRLSTDLQIFHNLGDLVRGLGDRRNSGG